MHAGDIEHCLLEYDRAIAEIAREDARSKRLMQLRASARPRPVRCSPVSVPGTTSETAGRWQLGSDSRRSVQQRRQSRLGSITKPGDAYLRGLLVSGAHAVIASLDEKQDRFSRWDRTLVERRGYWRAAIAIAAKNARLAWASLKCGDDFKLESVTV